MKIRMKEKKSTKQDQLDFRKIFNLINQLKKNLAMPSDICYLSSPTRDPQKDIFKLHSSALPQAFLF